MSNPVVEVHNLRKTYGQKVAVADLSFAVAAGEIFGILGPNGSGKTTAVECIAGLRDADGGDVRVLGIDPQTHPELIRDHVGVQFQEAGLHDKITVHEALTLFASFYESPADVDELLSVLDLQDKRDAQFRNLSGGQKQRVSIALALVGNPKVAILDELTTGLDPQARRTTWEVVRRVRNTGATVLLVTHFMEEAERLCDRVIIIDRGQILAEGSPQDLINSVGGAQSLEDVFGAITPEARSSLDHQGGLTMATTLRLPGASLGALRTRGFGRLVLTEGKVSLRGSDLFWALLFPTLLLVGQAVIAPELREIATGDTWAGTPFYGVAVINVILPAMLAMPIAITALTIMPATFGGFREKGILRRFSATPMRPQSMFAAHFIINVTMALAGALIAVIVTSFLFHIAIPNNVAMVVLGFVLGTAAMMALGSVVAARVSRASAGTAIGNIIFFPLLLTAGVFTVIEPGTVLYQIARVTPLGAASQVMSYGWFGGHSFPWIQIVTMIAWTAVLTPLAVKLFKWR